MHKRKKFASNSSNLMRNFVMKQISIGEKYEILELLGRGNFGETRKVFCKESRRFMVMKTIAKDIADDKSA